MGEEFYAAIKLVSGEEVFSLISYDENDGDPLLILQSPVIMKVIDHGIGSYVKIKPWMEVPNDDLFIIKLDKVITMTEVKDRNLIHCYEKYNNDEDDDKESIQTHQDGRVKISDKMGYISSVQEARKKLEDLFKEQ